MSRRIHEIAKEVNLDNKKVLELLRERGFEVKTVSSTIDNISAAAFIDEYKTDMGDASETAAEEPKVSPPKVNIPVGAIVKSAEDIERERREREDAEQARLEAELEKRRASRVVPAPQTPSTAGKPPPAPTVRMPRPASGSTPPPAGLRPPASRKPGGNAPVPPPATPPPSKSPAPLPPREKSEPEPEVRIKEESSNRPPIPPRAGAPIPPPMRPSKPETEDVPEAEAEPADDGDASELKKIQIKPPIVVRDFALLIGMKPFKLISELMDMGIFSGMNQSIDEETAMKLAVRHGFDLEVRHRGEEQVVKQEEDAPDEDDPELMEPRPPVVCVLGHVDHGKTTLLDSIRKTNVVKGEAGGITQHVGAYQVEHEGQKITFLDTPGHAAFSRIRERGAAVTDIAILVVAADDGFMPQTDEALKFAQRANVPVVVAINKKDAKGANIDRVKQQMQERNIASEDWGGETQCEAISALNNEGIEDLLSAVLIQAEILELKANPKCPPKGAVVESQIEQGRGSTSTVIIQKGTLKVGDSLVSGESYCRVKALLDENGKRLKSAPPSTPVSLMGWSSTPSAGASFHTVKNDKAAKREVEETIQERKRAEAAVVADSTDTDIPNDFESLLAAIDRQKAKVLRLIIKADVGGSVEALSDVLSDIKSDKVQLMIVDQGVGPITKKDIDLASGAGATVVGFNVKLDNGVQSIAKHHDVHIIQHKIIYELIDQVKEAMGELLDPEYKENKLGAAEVRMVFPAAKGQAAGCMVTEGLIKRDCKVRLMRKDELVHEGKLSTLRRFKDDVAEVRAGYECGMQIAGFNDYEEGDIIEAIEILELRPEL